ncbi:MAG: DUF805 domain-containing protein, partial [Clostridiales Family XIII bacterium]|nr:DUF805 domain-containing protein [Clostridiales Family XIII bacterium]
MFLEHYKLYWKNYVNFRGRTPRSGYWFVQLWGFIINVIISLVALAVASSAGISLLSVALDSGFGSDPLSLASSLGGVVGSVIGLLV